MTTSVYQWRGDKGREGGPLMSWCMGPAAVKQGQWKKDALVTQAPHYAQGGMNPLLKGREG